MQKLRNRLAWLAIAPLLLAASVAQAQDYSYKVLYFFPEQSYPYGGVILDNAGNIYGTTCGGGEQGDGTVFKLAPDGTETILHAFAGGTDGACPFDLAGLIMDQTGVLYGTTIGGGSDVNGSCNLYGGCGTVFKLAPDGTETVLYSFQGYNDGANPRASLIADMAGNLYGTTPSGGNGTGAGCGDYGCGTVFKVTSGGMESVLHSFGGGNDGAQPIAGLIAGNAGNLYGTTPSGGGGGGCNGSGCGTVFKVTLNGRERVLHSFQGGSDGEELFASLIGHHAGNFYGTTYIGGGSGCNGYGCGTVFKLAPDGTETILHVFAGGTDGQHPYAGLIRDKAGNLYGTTTGGGGNGCNGSGCGTVFELAPDGSETILHAFAGGNDGAYPEAGLTEDKTGHLYGTTLDGGAEGYGTVFELSK